MKISNNFRFKFNLIDLLLIMILMHIFNFHSKLFNLIQIINYYCTKHYIFKNL